MSPIDATAPLVSVLIVTYREYERFGRCFRALQRVIDGLSAEVIVVVNGVPLRDEHREAEAAGAQLYSAPFNLGFPAGLQVARGKARGRYLAILQDDVEVQDGWLEPLIGVLDDDPSVGVVSSRVERDDGGLEHEGFFLWRDATAEPLGDPASPGTLRPVDAAGSAALLVRAEAWDGVGGPDFDLFPTWFVDIDLCLSLGRGGWNVMSEPRSVVRHGVHVSTSDQLRHYMHARHQPRIVRRHAVVLGGRPAIGDPPEAVAVQVARSAAEAELRRTTPRPPPVCFHREPMPVEMLIPHMRRQSRRFRAGYYWWRARRLPGRAQRRLMRMMRGDAGRLQHGSNG